MLVIGLTGGIGSGKSTVAALFAACGAPVIDTDLIAHELLRTPEIRDAVIALHGDHILDTRGEIDRRALGARVFADPDALAHLEALLHPRIREEVARRLDELRADYVIVVVPLLVEKGKYDFIDRVALVDCAEQIQQQRTMARDGLPAGRVAAIMARQAGREQRRQAADDIIDNSGTNDDLRRQVLRLDRRYRELAGA